MPGGVFVAVDVSTALVTILSNTKKRLVVKPMSSPLPCIICFDNGSRGCQNGSSNNLSSGDSHLLVFSYIYLKKHTTASFFYFSVSTLPPLDIGVMSPSAAFNLPGDEQGPTFTTRDVDDDDDDEIEMSPLLVGSSGDVFFDVATGGVLPASPASPGFMQGDSAFGEAATQRSASPVLQEDAFPTYTVAPTVLADLPGSFEIRRNTRGSSALPSQQVIVMPLYYLYSKNRNLLDKGV